jgi:hypothetical protein
MDQTMSKKTEFTVRVLRPNEIDGRLISAWADLEARAVVPNAFLSPYFVMPAIKYLEPSSNILAVFVEKTSAGIPLLVGVALFKIHKPIRQFPLTHLTAFKSIHSYLAGFLIDRDHVGDALKMIYGFVTDKKNPWHGLHINSCAVESLFTEEAKMASADFKMRWTVFEIWQRAVLNPSDCSIPDMLYLNKSQRKDYLRHVRGLNKLGHLDWRMLCGTDRLEKSVDQFIRLEHIGWKGVEGTSLYSNSSHLNFYKEMARGFNKNGRVFFTELLLDDKIISSTSNLISGKVGFGFKMGWDTEYAKYSPGIVNVIHLMEHGENLFKDIEFMDSSAAPDSYVNAVWSGRRDIVEGIFTFTNMGQLALTGVEVARKIKTALLSRRKIAPIKSKKVE